jgi:hypothetical protein
VSGSAVVESGTRPDYAHCYLMFFMTNKHDHSTGKRLFHVPPGHGAPAHRQSGISSNTCKCEETAGPKAGAAARELGGGGSTHSRTIRKRRKKNPSDCNRILDWGLKSGL